MRKFWSVTAATLLGLSLVACDKEQALPNEESIRRAMQTWHGDKHVDTLENVRCDSLGYGKFVCSFTIGYIGERKQEMEHCFFSGAKKLTVEPFDRCY